MRGNERPGAAAEVSVQMRSIIKWRLFDQREHRAAKQATWAFA